MSSDVIEFEAAPGEDVRVRCSNTLARGGMLMMLAIGFAVLRVRLERE